MRTVAARPRDTTLEADRVQVALIRAASPARRLQIAFGFSAAIITVARRALARAHPDAPECERALQFVSLHYGRELADDVRADLRRRGRVQPPRP